MAMELTTRKRRWVNALLVLGTIALGFVVVRFVADVFFFFGDIILVFFLAWLLAFILSPVVGRLLRTIPILSRVGAVVLVYSALLAGLIILVLLVADAMARSISDFIASVPSLRDDLPALLAPWQARLNELGLRQVDVVVQANSFVDNLNRYATELAGPLQSVAVASLGAMGNLLLVLILSLYIVIDSDRILSFLLRLVPPAYKEEARLLETSIAQSFGGFLRGQALLGLVYAGIAVLTSAVLGLAYLPVTSAAAGLLMGIPFFGPFVAWVPPVLVAIFTKPEATIPAIVIMGIGWIIVMNVLQPRLMEKAVGIHPIVVLGSVLVGSKVAGIPGAIFAIPIAAVISAFFFNYLGRVRNEGPVTSRAARRLEVREGRRVRVPREPKPGVDPDVEEAPLMAHPVPAAGPSPSSPKIEPKVEPNVEPTK
jgi:predicted PurR-regulated permease PerM